METSFALTSTPFPPAPPTATFTSSPTATGTSTVTPTPSDTPVPATATPPACLTQAGKTDQGNLRSKLLRLPMEYRVHLPPCYDVLADRRYPVLYLIHGQNFNDDQWDRLGADEAADRLAAAGDIPPFILVMPRDRSWDQPEVDMFGRVLVEELIPIIDQDYRTLTDRNHRAIGGLSRGAGWAIHLGLSRWDLFGAIGAHSLPVFWSDTGKVRGWLKAIPTEQLPRIYMDTGEKDYLIRSTTWFEKVLTDLDIPHEWHLFSGYHEEAYWQSHVEQYIRWYSAGWDD